MIAADKDAAKAKAKLRAFRLRLLSNCWHDMVGHQPTPDEATLLAEALERRGTIQEALTEVLAAVESGSHPGLLD